MKGTLLFLSAAMALGGCTSAGLPGAGNTLEQADKAHELAVEVDLRNAANAEEAHFAQSGTYTTSLAGVVPSQDVHLSVPRADAAGYCIQATHADVPGTTWHLAKGEVGPSQGPC